jgi:hypothetical protein
MYNWRMRAYFLIVALLADSAKGQLVQTGTPGSDYCYRIERIEPNLALQKEIRIFATIKDQSGGSFRSSRLQLRK